MVRPGCERLTGRVEVDETFVGALEEGARRRGAVKKVLIMEGIEDKGGKIGRIWLRRCRTARPTACRLHRRGCRTREHRAHRWVGRLRPREGP